jgi:hypothetical protein
VNIEIRRLDPGSSWLNPARPQKNLTAKSAKKIRRAREEKNCSGLLVGTSCDETVIIFQLQ